MQIHWAWPSSARSSSLVKYSSMKPCWYALRPWRPLPHDFLSWSILRGLAALDSSNLPVLEQGWETWRSLVLDQWSHVISRQTCGLEVLTTSKPQAPYLVWTCIFMFGLQPSIPHDVSFEIVVFWYDLVIPQNLHQPCSLDVVSTGRLLETWKPRIWSWRRASSSSVIVFWQILRVFENDLGSRHTQTWCFRFGHWKLFRTKSLSTPRSGGNCCTLPFHVTSIPHAVSVKYVLLDFKIC